MSDCERLSDRMPEVAMQRAAWTAEEAAHLASCADCRDEWDLVQAARRLGAGAPTVDPAAVAAAVQARLAAERAGLRHRWAWALGAAAAAAAIVLAFTGGRETPSRAAPAAVAEAEPMVPLPELEGLETAQLDTLLRALDGPLAGTSAPDSTTVEDDVDAELEQILVTWGG